MIWWVWIILGLTANHNECIYTVLYCTCNRANAIYSLYGVWESVHAYIPGMASTTASSNLLIILCNVLTMQPSQCSAAHSVFWCRQALTGGWPAGARNCSWQAPPSRALPLARGWEEACVGRQTTWAWFISNYATCRKELNSLTCLDYFKKTDKSDLILMIYMYLISQAFHFEWIYTHHCQKWASFEIEMQSYVYTRITDKYTHRADTVHH